MVAGNPDKIAFIIEKVSDWSSCGCVNGVMQLYMNGIQYPKDLRTSAIDGELYSMLSNNSPLVSLPQNEQIFNLPPHKAIVILNKLACEKGNYSYSVPFQELEDAGYFLFMVCSGGSAKFILAQHTAADSIVYTDGIKLDISTVCDMVRKIVDFRESLTA